MRNKISFYLQAILKITIQRQTLITTDGTTLLGADDKAGITRLLRQWNSQTTNPNTENQSFTPDEEIGRGAHHFDVPNLALIGLTPLTGVKWRRNMRISMRLEPKLPQR
jgi:hypothetical protein